MLSTYKPINKREFNPTSKEDLKLYADFRRNMKWGDKGCPFTLEWPHLNVSSMILDKIMQAHLDTLITQTKSK